MGSDRVDAALGVIEEGYAMLATESFDTQSHPELLGVQSRLEAVSRKQPAITHKLIARLTAQTSPVELGGKSWTDVLSNRLRIGRGEARRRLDRGSCSRYFVPKIRSCRAVSPKLMALTTLPPR
jgi:Domain of unknown function (DUF222)